ARRDLPAVLRKMLAHLRWQQINQRLAELGHKSVEVDECGDALRLAVGDAGHHHAAVAVADEHRALQTLVAQNADDVGDVGGEIDGRRGEVGALADAGERRREDLVAGRAQEVRNALPHPAAAPGAVNQYEIQGLAVGAVGLNMLDMSMSSSLTAALLRASISASLRGVSLVACSKASASLKLNEASALGSG